MDPIRFAMSRPVTVACGVLLVVLAGLVGLGAIPIQLTPTIDRPIVTITTNWPGRSPEEVVDDITKEQEKRLKNVANLRDMRTVSREGSATVTLEFYLGTDMARALLDVSDALRQVPEYPEEVDEPAIEAAEGAAENAIAWLILDLDPARAAAHPDFDVTTLYDAIDREVKPLIERVPGVALVNIYGGREPEVRVLADPRELARRGLTHQDLVDALRGENRNISAGSIPEGKRDYRVRLVGQFLNEADVLETVVAYRDGRPVLVRDIATVEISNERPRGFVRSMGHPCIAMPVIRQSDANVVEVMAQVRDRLDEIRRDVLPRLHPTAGTDLRLRQVYDETVYIESSIELVLSNLVLGGILATMVLFLFLRSARATLIVSIAIPTSIVGTFLVVLLTGRTLNVVSLAGLAFATGMVVDNAIVVLENIERRRAMGDPMLLAIERGTREVWVAILGSTATTVVVFLPMLTIREEVGQLFFDLSLALAVSVTASLAVAILVIPAAATVLMGEATRRDTGLHGVLRRLFGLAALGARLSHAVGSGVRWFMTGWRAWTLRPAVILLVVAASLLGSRWLMPPLDYLPAGNQNLVFGGMLIPPGLSVEQQTRYATRMEDAVRPYLITELPDAAAAATLPPIPRPFEPGTPPFLPVAIENFFVGGWQGSIFAGAISTDPQRVIPLGQLLTNAMQGMPDAFGGARQTSLFGRGVGVGNSINLEVSGPDIQRVIAAAQAAFMTAAGEWGFGNVQPDPANFNLFQQEWQLELTRTGRELGLRTGDLDAAVRGLFDGAFAGDFRLNGRNVDLVVLPTGGQLDYKERLADIPVMTPGGRVVPMSSIADIVPARAPQEVQRIEELPSVTIQVVPRQGETVEAAMDLLRTKVIEPLRSGGIIDPSMRVRLEGTAAKLDEFKTQMLGARASGAPLAPWQIGIEIASILVIAVALAAATWCFARAARRRDRTFASAAVGLLLLGMVVAGILLGIALRPELLTARFVWAVLVCYLVMCAIFESFVHPLVIMLSVPPALVGGFAGLRVVHEWTSANPDIAPQQLDVLTMIGFVILVGTVVNNAILIVEQSLNFMNPEKFASHEQRLPPIDAITQSVRTRVRPILMTAMTTVLGGLPLVLAPGAGSEMYRGLGAVVLGGLLCSSFITLLVVPLAFSIVYQLQEGVRSALGLGEDLGPVRTLHRLDLLGRAPTPELASHHTPSANGVAPTPAASTTAEPRT